MTNRFVGFDWSPALGNEVQVSKDPFCNDWEWYAVQGKTMRAGHVNEAFMSAVKRRAGGDHPISDRWYLFTYCAGIPETARLWKSQGSWYRMVVYGLDFRDAGNFIIGQMRTVGQSEIAAPWGASGVLIRHVRPGGK